MASLFISYSRRDIDAARRLTAALSGQDLDFWIDWDSLEPTVDWWKEIQRGIEQADNFLFLISPDSIRSPICGQEIEHAVKNGKRLIPVVVAGIRSEKVPPELASRNWIFLRENDPWETGFGKLVKAIKTDFDWVQAHRRLQVKALEWERSDRDGGYLLRGRDLRDAEAQLEADARKEPYPTTLQRDYLESSRQAARRQRRITMALAAVGAIALAAAFYLLLVRPYLLRSMARGEMVPIAAGPVVLGTDDPQASDEEIPQWSTSLGEFEIDRYEVSNAQYKLCVLAGACQAPGDLAQYDEPEFANFPVAGVTAFQADAYCRWLGKRLPTELQWERAARGPDGRPWPWGDAEPTPERANLGIYDDQAEGTLLPVDSLPEGASLGAERAYHLVGNVWEWTSSYPDEQGGYERDPARYWDSSQGGPVSGLVQRGGSWDDNTVEHVTRRDVVLADDDTRQTGIRCVKSQ